MNDPTHNSGIVEVERLLRVVADDDCILEAPPDVRAAVMRTWDAVHAPIRARRRRARASAAPVAIGSIAAALVVVVVMSRGPSTPSWREPIVTPSVEQPPVVTNVPSSDRGTPAETHQPRRRRAEKRGEPAAAGYGPGVLLVADPILDASAMSIVRVRVPRAALAPLGIPLVEPNGGGSVDLEILVGEDGVARTIRRAMPVPLSQERIP